MNKPSKKTLLLGTLIAISFLLFFVPFSTALYAPWYDYCTDMGYTIEIGTRDDTGTQVVTPDSCVFSDGQNCVLEQFYSGECGADYVRVPECKTEGQETTPFASCCEGLKSSRLQSVYSTTKTVVFGSSARCQDSTSEDSFLTRTEWETKGYTVEQLVGIAGPSTGQSGVEEAKARIVASAKRPANTELSKNIPYTNDEAVPQQKTSLPTLIAIVGAVVLVGISVLLYRRRK